MQKHLKLFCSQSVPGLLFVMLSGSALQRGPLYLAQRFLLFTHMLSCLEFNSRLLYPGLLLSWTFLCIVFSDALFVCVFLSLPPTTCVFEFWPFPFDFHFFLWSHLSFFHCHLALTAPITICQHLCPNLVPLLHSQRRLYKRLQTFLPH